MRAQFQYTEAPNTTLCMALLELYPDTSRCADVCLHVCNELSRQLVEDPRSLDHYLMIRLVVLGQLVGWLVNFMANTSEICYILNGTGVLQ